MTVRSALAGACLLIASSAGAQMSAADHIAAGDRDHAAMNATSALRHYEAALAADSNNFEALYKAARNSADAAEFSKNEAERDAAFKKAEQYARRAVRARPSDAEGHFHVARSLGLRALSMGPRDRVKFGTEVRAHALEALKLNPKHPGALHVLGMWNFNIMTLSGPVRFIAKNVLGGKVFGEASWDNATRYMEQSVEVDPDRLVHKLDLGKVYEATGKKDKAREMWTLVAQGSPSEPNDQQRVATAKELLAKLK